MRAPTTQSEEFISFFTPRKVAVVKVKCLLQTAIDAVAKIPGNRISPYMASLNLISSLFDDEFDKKAYQEICSFDYRLRHEDHPCGKKAEDYVHQMVDIIQGSKLLTDPDS